MISSKRPIVVYIEQARIPDETTSITRSEVPITGDIVVHHRIQNGANNKAMGDGFLKELYDVLNGAVGENLRFEDGASVFVYTSCAILSILPVQEALRIMRILNEIFGLGPIYQYIVSERARKSSIFAKKIIMICTCLKIQCLVKPSKATRELSF